MIARVRLFASLLIALVLAACAPDTKSSSAAPVLLFNGTGTSVNDVAAVERVLRASGLMYATANSADLNAMTDAQLLSHQLLVVPGGNFVDMAASVTPSATASVRRAVQSGLNYLGICAGGFLAGRNKYNTFDLTGVQFGFYAIERQGIRKAPVLLSVPEGPTLEHYWEDGPEFTGWGAIVAKYPDGTPAIVQGESGKGWVVLTGIHPEAPENWRRGMTFTTPATIDNAYAATLIAAALHRTRLPQF